MGNCWRMPDDHLRLLPIPSSSSSSINNISETSMPKLVNSQRSIDLQLIKAAQCRNLLDHLPLVSYNENSFKQTECAICLIDFLPDEKLRQLPCHGAHIFHQFCIDSWLEKNFICPHCSSNIDATVFLKFIPQSNTTDDD